MGQLLQGWKEESCATYKEALSRHADQEAAMGAREEAGSVADQTSALTSYLVGESDVSRRITFEAKSGRDESDGRVTQHDRGVCAAWGIQKAGEPVPADSLRRGRVGTLLQPRMKRVEGGGVAREDGGSLPVVSGSCQLASR